MFIGTSTCVEGTSTCVGDSEMFTVYALSIVLGSSIILFSLHCERIIIVRTFILV